MKKIIYCALILLAGYQTECSISTRSMTPIPVNQMKDFQNIKTIKFDPNFQLSTHQIESMLLLPVIQMKALSHIQDLQHLYEENHTAKEELFNQHYLTHLHPKTTQRISPKYVIKTYTKFYYELTGDQEDQDLTFVNIVSPNLPSIITYKRDGYFVIENKSLKEYKSLIDKVIEKRGFFIPLLITKIAPDVISLIMINDKSEQIKVISYPSNDKDFLKEIIIKDYK